MILPGTLVQLVTPTNSDRDYRQLGIYTVFRVGVDTGCGNALYLCEVPHDAVGKCSCQFRIIAPPITEADRLEASAPDAPAKPKRVRA